MMSPRAHPVAQFAMLVALAALAPGCGPARDSFARKHFEQQPKAEARKNWDAMRSNARLQVARRHLAAGRLKEAEQEWRQALSAAPDRPDVLLVGAQLWLELGEPAKAKEALVRAARGSPDPEIDYWSGIVAQRYGDRPAALACYSRAAKKSPLSAEYVVAQAELLVESDRSLDALALIESRLRDFDGDVALRMLAAQIYRDLGLETPALERCREAVRLAKNDPVCLAELGVLLVSARRPEEAVSILRPVIERAREPGVRNQESGVRRQASVLTPDSDNRDAITPETVYALVEAYAALERWDDVRWALQPALETGRLDATTATLYARAALMGGDTAAAERALACVPRKVMTCEALLLAGCVALRKDDAPAAEAAATEALQRDPSSALAYCLLGQAAERTLRHEAARAAYETSLQLAPDMALVQALMDAMHEDAARRRDRLEKTPD